MAAKATASRNLAMEAVRVTEASARAASRYMGRGDEQAADEAAVDAMHQALAWLDIAGTIRIGEGLPGATNRLYVGEQVGSGDGPTVDVALMPLEGRSIVARGDRGAMSVVAMAEDGGFLHVPDVYMDKIAVGGGLPDDLIDLDETPATNLGALARAKNVDIGDLLVCILDRPRNSEVIAKSREAGARINLIADGDVSGVIATTWPGSQIDIYMGIGGALQGVLSAAALRCANGQMQGRLLFREDAERRKAVDLGIKDLERKYRVSDMARGEVTFSATGVTSGAVLKGVKRSRRMTMTHSVVMRSKTGTLRFVEAYHGFAKPATG